MVRTYILGTYSVMLQMIHDAATMKRVRTAYSLVPRPFIQRVYRFQYNALPSPRAILQAIRAGVGWVWDRD